MAPKNTPFWIGGQREVEYGLCPVQALRLTDKKVRMLLESIERTMHQKLTAPLILSFFFLYCIEGCRGLRRNGRTPYRTGRGAQPIHHPFRRSVATMRSQGRIRATVNLAKPRKPQHSFRGPHGGTHNPRRREVSRLSTVNRRDLTTSERSVPPACQSQEVGLGSRVDVSAFNADIRTRSEMFGTL